MAELLLPFVVEELRDRHGRLRRVQREQGILPSHACLIWAQRWHTGRRSVVILTDSVRFEGGGRLGEGIR